jgi:hypothetical protein
MFLTRKIVIEHKPAVLVRNGGMQAIEAPTFMA